MRNAVFSGVLDQAYDQLNKNLRDTTIRKFYSSDPFDVQREMFENVNVSRAPVVFCSVASARQLNRRSIPTDTQEQVVLSAFIGIQDIRDEQRAFSEAEYMMYVVQAYLSRIKYGGNFAGPRHPEGWTKNIQFQNDEFILFQLDGNINLELDLESIITDYET